MVDTGCGKYFDFKDKITKKNMKWCCGDYYDGCEEIISQRFCKKCQAWQIMKLSADSDWSDDEENFLLHVKKIIHPNSKN